MEKEKQILTAARTCFLHFGYKATTVELIAKTAQIGKGTIYNFFTTKEEILEKVMDAEINGLIEIADNLMNDSPLEITTFQKYLYISLKYVKEGDLFHQLSLEAEATAHPDVIKALKRMEAVAFLKLKEMVQLYVDQKQLIGYDAELTTFLIMELHYSLVYKWPENHTTLPEERINQILVRLYPLV